jgi:putative transposon-encoded protein
MYKLFYSVEVPKMRKINLLNKKFKLEDNIEAVIEGKIKKLGNGAMVIASKKYLNRNVYILIRK